MKKGGRKGGNLENIAKFANDFEFKTEKDDMETLKETTRSRFSVSIPDSDLSMFRSMSRRMGWEAKKITPSVRKKEVRYPALDRAIEDVKKGNVVTFNDVDDMMQYLMSED